MEQSTITGFMSKWERRKKAEHACPLLGRVIFKQRGIRMSREWYGMRKTCWFFLINWSFAPKFLWKLFFHNLIIHCIIRHFQEKARELLSLWHPIWSNVEAELYKARATVGKLLCLAWVRGTGEDWAKGRWHKANSLRDTQNRTWILRTMASSIFWKTQSWE
jgi:hypothetical protein